MWSKWYWLIAIAVLAPIVAFYVMSFLAARPTNLGVKDGKFAPCPASPNCVSTQADDEGHQIAAITFTGSTADAMAKLKSAIAKLPRAQIVTETPDYLHVECTSFIFRFVDDVEFWIDEANHTIHFRSASRVGHGDLGVNRKRMEEIRAHSAHNHELPLSQNKPRISRMGEEKSQAFPIRVIREFRGCPFTHRGSGSHLKIQR